MTPTHSATLVQQVKPVLKALDTRNGNQLYKRSDANGGWVNFSGLALSNDKVLRPGLRFDCVLFRPCGEVISSVALAAQLDVCYCSDVVSIKESAENAGAFAKAALGSERTVGLRLEEVESTTVGSEDAWLITLSMPIPDEAISLGDVLRGKGRREYKSFTVRKRDGEVTSMKIRELADA